MSTATAPVPAPATKTLGGNAAYHNFHNDFIHVQDPREIMGRRRMYGLELMVIIFATLAQALASSSPAMMGAMNIVGIVIFWRVLMVRSHARPAPAPASGHRRVLWSLN